MQPTRRWIWIALATLLGLALSFTSVAASQAGSARVVAAKKKCKKAKRATQAKKKCRTKKSSALPNPPATAEDPSGPPRPLGFDDIPAVLARVDSQAQLYCEQRFGEDCRGGWAWWTDFAYAPDCPQGLWQPYSWRCKGYIVGYGDGLHSPLYQCDFWEIVERQGVDGITSHRDTTLGDDGFFNCFWTQP